MTRQAVADLLLALGAALIIATFLLAYSPSLQAKLLPLSRRERYPNMSLGFVILLLCALGVAEVAGGLSVLSHS